MRKVKRRDREAKVRPGEERDEWRRREEGKSADRGRERGRRRTREKSANANTHRPAYPVSLSHAFPVD